jgi:hypothetical protein
MIHLKSDLMKRTTQNILITATITLVMLCTAGLRAQTMSGIVVNPCANNGQINVSVTGLTPPISYTYQTWMNSQTIVHANINSTSNSLVNIPAYHSNWANIFNVWVVSASDGTNFATATFTLVPPFSFGDSLQVAACPALSSVQATGFSGGTAPFSCLWTNLNTFLTYNTNPAAVPNGQYSLTVTDNAGCIVSSVVSPSTTINVFSSSGMNFSVTGASANCTNGTASLSVSGGSSPYTFLWSNAATTQNLSGLSSGSYSVQVTDNIGCQGTAYYWVQQALTINLNPVVTNATCLQNNGGVMLFPTGGTGPYSFNWSNMATTQNITAVAGGTSYMVQVTDANGCNATQGIYVGATTPINVTYVTTASSCTAATGGATLTATGGTSPYSIVWYTFPANTAGNGISSKPSGLYSFNVTDNVGCVRTGMAQIPTNSFINANAVNGNAACPSTAGNIGMTVTGQSPPFTYLWSNAATSASQTGVALGVYNCTVTDAAGCSVIKTAYVNQVSPIFLGLSSTNVTCLFSANGSATASASGGAGPYTYAWSNAQSGSSVSGLSMGWISVTATATNGCKTSASTYIGNSATSNACYCTITGTVYTDTNTNCVQNSGENGLQNIQVHCTGFGYAYTNANGVYSFKVPSGTYTITETVLMTYPLAPCQTNNQPVTVTAAPNCTTIVNFANTVTAISDLRIVTSNVNWPIPGNQYTQRVIVQNDGTVNESTVKLGYKHDGNLSFSSCTPWSLTQQNSVSFPTWYSINSGFTTLTPGSWSASNLLYNVGANVPLNTVCVFNDTVAKNAPLGTQWLNDNSPWNNLNNHQVNVVGSWDPNFKEVSPQGTGATGDITAKDSILTYVVHFQNEGNYFAQNVTVIDTLDANLNITTLRPGYSDHKFDSEISETGVATFSFKNINLPWKSAYGDALSSGMFMYSVKTKKNLALGAQIRNKAAIYFDLNKPVITNTTLNTLTKPSTDVSIEEHKWSVEDKAILFPNPAGSYFTLVVSSASRTNGLLTVYDISGREIISKQVEVDAGQSAFTENTTSFQNGIYFVKIKTDEVQVTKKLIIAK